MANGVEVRGKKIRVYFRYKGELIRETLDLDDTPDNRAYAERMVAQIRHEIKAGTYDHARQFPESKNLQDSRLDYWLDTLLDIKERRVSDSTFRGYKNKIDSHIKPHLGDKVVNQVDRVDVETWISKDLDKLASKTIKDVVALLRMTYAFYRTRYPGVPDPTAGIKIELPDDDDPDPFTKDEIKKIVATEPRNNRWQELNLIQFMTWSGPRVSEAIAIAWEDVIDLDKGLIKFQRARVRGQFKATKTKRSMRVHELIAPAREALQRQWDLTGHLDPFTVEIKARDNRTIKKEKLHFIFMNTHTGEPHYDDFRLRDRFFKYHLEKVGVRYRGPGQCRHTYISQMLTANMPIEWISKQTGTSVEMIRRRYGKWIDEDAKDMVATAESRLGL
ncbi:MAG: DUF3596 domain-containing protein [Gammaproteobacteria bacterium]|nr:DUF3596 domain-containing protein [Gammaproteobacteria bacterium]